AARRLGGDADDAPVGVELLRLGVRRTVGILAHPVRGSALRSLLWRAGPGTPAAPDPAHLAAPGRRVELVLDAVRSAKRHQCPDHHSDPGAVRGADRRRGASAATRAGPPQAVSDVALPVAVRSGAGGVVVPV